MSSMNNYDAWNEIKKKINNRKKYSHPREREIWWCSVGLNIGSEVYGKGDYYTRPVLVVNAEGAESFIGIPLTSKIKKKKYGCVIETDDGFLHTVQTYQTRSFDKKRLLKRMYVLHQDEYMKILEYIKKLYKI